MPACMPDIERDDRAMQITPEPLTAAAFAPYGEVLALDKAATDPRQAFAAGLENRRPEFGKAKV